MGVCGDHRGPPLQSLGGLISKGLSVLLEEKGMHKWPTVGCQNIPVSAS